MILLVINVFLLEIVYIYYDDKDYKMILKIFLCFHHL